MGNDLGHEDIAPLLEFLAVRPDPKSRDIAGLRYLKNEELITHLGLEYYD